MALYQSGSGLGALVGVGTTNPTSNLQVYGTPIATGNVFSVLNTAASGNVAQFSSSAGTALIINASGNVGIGVTNPQVLLTAVGTCTLGTGAGTTTAGYHTGMVNIIGGGTRALLRIENNNSVGSPGIIFGEGGGFTEDTQPTIKKVQGTNNLAIMCGGNVGIGTTSPRCTLDVVGSGTTAGIFANRFYLAGPGDNTDSSGSLNDGGPWYGLGYSVDSGLTSYIQLASFYGLALKTGGSSILMIGGNVGIGTTANINSPLTVYNSASTSTYTGTTAWGNIHLMPQGTNNSWAGITFGGSSGGTIQQSTQASITVDSNSSTGTNMRFNVGYLFANGALERLTIIGQTGNVGIGTTNPAVKCDVYTTGHGIRQTDSGGGAQVEFYTNTTAGWVGTFNNYPLYFFTNNSAAQMILSTAGYLGVGYTAPACQVHIWNSGTGGQIGIGQQADATPYMRIGMDSGYNQYICNNAYWTGSAYNYVNTAGYGGLATAIIQVSGYIDFCTVSGGTNPIAWASRMRVTNGGNVGIGITNPSSTLHVSGAARVTGITYHNSYSDWTSLVDPNNTQTDASTWPVLSFSGAAIGGYDWGIIKGSTAVAGAVFGRQVGGLHMSSNYDQGFFTSGWTPLLVVKGSDGTCYHKGNVGIGMTNPSRPLVVKRAGAAVSDCAIMVANNGSGTGARIQTYDLTADVNAWMGLGTDMNGNPYEHSLYFPYGSSNQGRQTFGTFNGTSFSPKMTILGTGYIGINKTNPSWLIDVQGNGVTTNHMQLATTDGGSGAFATTLKMVATGSGGIWGSVNYHQALYTASSFFGGYGYGQIVAYQYNDSTIGYFNIATNGTGGFALSGYGNGTLSITSGRVYNSSDGRMKSNINYISDTSTPKIMGLKPATFSFTTDPNNTLKMGFIAQDLEQYIPIAVDAKKYEYMWKTKKAANGEIVPDLDENGNYQYTDEIRPRSVDNMAIVATLVKAFQEQVQVIQDLKQRIQILESAA